MAGKFELYTDSAGKFPFRLKAGNGEVHRVLTGKVFPRQADVIPARDWRP